MTCIFANDVCFNLHTSLRILGNLAVFSDSISASEDDMIQFALDTYALQLQNIDSSLFNGQTFTINLGSVEEALSMGNGLRGTLKTSEMVMKILENTTAAVQLPNNFFETMQECNVGIKWQRLSYFAFLTDVLFQSQNQSESGFHLGSIIVTIRLRCGENLTVHNPITAIFRTIDQVILKT